MYSLTKENLALFIGDNFIGKLSDMEVDGSFVQVIKKGNTMQYMTNQMLQRFMSHMTTTLKVIQINRVEIDDEIEYMKDVGGSSHPRYRNMLNQWYKYREGFKIRYVKNSRLQEHVKRGFIGHRTLQKMEKVVTTWILQEQQNCSFAYEDYLENRYDTFYRNKSKQAKKKLAKLVELQQAIRKQKSITKD